MSHGEIDPYPDVGSGDDREETPIEAFWREAKHRARLGRLEVVIGQEVGTAVVPPAWRFGDSADLADELLQRVLAGTKTAAASAYWGYEAEGAALPAPGDLAIVLDSADRPRALIATTEVTVCPFDEVPAEHAEAEGEETLEAWREGHQRFFAAELAAVGREFTEDLAVVLERFRVLVAADTDGHIAS